MTNPSFADIGSHVWQPTTAYQTIQATIQTEVNQGLWANHAHPDVWCCVQTAPPHGVNNSWTTHTFQHTSDSTQKATVTWPAGWPPPAENVNGVLPSHFFGGATGTTSQAVMVPLSQSHDSPADQPTYKPAGLCL